jgi:acyl carrier protein phosphodiesterase
MNWLAHIFLSDNHIDYQIGNLLADFLKGRAWAGSSPQFNAGLKMHLAIDRFTDNHPCIMTSKSRLGQTGRLKGVVIDITYDHLLSRNWHRYSNIPRDQFIDTFHKRSQAVLTEYPANARAFLTRLVESRYLTDYNTLDGLEKAFCRTDGRLSTRVLARESTLSYFTMIKQEIRRIEEDFLRFMPDLISHFKYASRLPLQTHWLR